MNWFSCIATQKSQKQRFPGRTPALATFAERKQTLYWTALMITGNAEAAEQSVVDAGGLAENDNYAFRDWLVRWGHSITARVAVKSVRSSIHAIAPQYADRKCSHRAHEQLSPEEIRTLHELNAYQVIRRVDILARAVLVLYGCRLASLSECALLLDVPLSYVRNAYCRALQMYREFAELAGRVRHSDSCQLYLVRYDSDGVPVWDRAPSRV